MCQGGIYDHLGGGFSRYSVDDKWLVPHFEKMLYDNAQLLELLALGLCSASAIRCFARARAETVGWLEREMTTPEGGFARRSMPTRKARKASSTSGSKNEIERLLGPDAAAFFARTTT